VDDTVRSVTCPDQPLIEVDTLDIDDDESYIKASPISVEASRLAIKLFGIY